MPKFLLFLLLLFPMALGAQTRNDLSTVFGKIHNEEKSHFQKQKARDHLVNAQLDPSVNGQGWYNPGGNSGSSSSSSSSYGSSNSSGGTLVGRCAAFGIGNAFGNTVTYNQTLEVYRDGGGYYIMSGSTPYYLRTNTHSTYNGYSVSQYRYTVVDVGNGMDIIWFLNL